MMRAEERTMAAPRNAKSPGLEPVSNLTPRIARLQRLLDTLSRQLSSSGEQSSNMRELEPHPTNDQESSHSGTDSFTDTVMPDKRPLEGPTLTSLLDSALKRTANLFSIEPSRSPRAEIQMSYSLHVNAKYRAHMDSAPERAVDLGSDLRAMMATLEGMAEVVHQCKAIARDIAAEQSKLEGAKEKSVNQHLLPVTDQGSGSTLLTRLGDAGIKSEFFL